MFRRTPILFITLALIVSACSSEVETTTTQPTTTTTTTRPTTTTTAPLTLDGAPDELNKLVESFYKYAALETVPPPAVPDSVLAQIIPKAGDTPGSGLASVGTFKGASVATVTVEEDLFLAVDDGSGWRIVGGKWPSLSIPAYYGEGPRLVAVVGSDARTGEPMDQTRADSIHFVGLDGAGGGAVVGLPRDSYVPIPGYGKRKITGSLALAGPDVMMQAFRDLTGLPLEGYVLTGFAGFQSLVDGVLGGIDVEVPFAINDKAAKATLSAGQQILDGFDALAFARARKTVPGGDFARSGHQGALLIGAAKGVRVLGPMMIPQLMEKAEPSLMTDLSPEQILTFSMMAIESNLDEMPNIVAPGGVGSAGGASVVFLGESALTLFADLADGRLED